VRWDAFCRKRDAIAAEQERLRATWVNPKITPVEDCIRVLGKPSNTNTTCSNCCAGPK
jgi:tRNA uridine 5-carboxymethylaminomethyl modification enzyme